MFDRKEYNKSWYANRRELQKSLSVENRRIRVSKAKDFVKSQKTGKMCVDCGVVYPHYVMDYDHISDDKVSNVSALVGKGASIDIISREIAKCELVCANCHRIRTFSRHSAKETRLPRKE